MKPDFFVVSLIANHHSSLSTDRICNVSPAFTVRPSSVSAAELYNEVATGQCWLEIGMGKERERERERERGELREVGEGEREREGEREEVREGERGSSDYYISGKV